MAESVGVGGAVVDKLSYIHISNLYLHTFNYQLQIPKLSLNIEIPDSGLQEIYEQRKVF